MSEQATKSSLRTALLAARKTMTPHEVTSKDQAITENCIDLIQKQLIKSLHAYLPLTKHNEIDTWPILEYIQAQHPDITIAIPVVQGEHLRSASFKIDTPLQPAKYDILEPIQPELLPENYHFGVIIVPALGFDRQGYRLGYGKGYYDKFLANQKNALTITLAYAASELKQLPHESHDITVNYIVTENEIIG